MRISQKKYDCSINGDAVITDQLIWDAPNRAGRGTATTVLQHTLMRHPATRGMMAFARKYFVRTGLAIMNQDIYPESMYRALTEVWEIAFGIGSLNDLDPRLQSLV